ncbi:MAG: hypothetical protein JNJ85_05390 [Candidatus Kapabacteria bacterium]|nr:hypothetical protein [Candidatus Kapabacteria bacterium]
MILKRFKSLTIVLFSITLVTVLGWLVTTQLFAQSTSGVTEKILVSPPDIPYLVNPDHVCYMAPFKTNNGRWKFKLVTSGCEIISNSEYNNENEAATGVRKAAERMGFKLQ